MSHRYLWTLILGLTVACGDGTKPDPTVSVTGPGGTIFIGNTAQFRAQLMSDDGSRDVTNEATWGSDAPNVATVSPSGLVTAVAAGEATIFADVNPRGTMRIRVFPNFNGSWAGNEVVASCNDSGVFAGVCQDPDFRPGQVFTHNSSYTQNDASVNAVIITGDNTTATTNGTITVAGLLELASAPVLPADPLINAEVQNWRARTDTPGRMTGSYELFLTAPGLEGTITVAARLQNVVRRSATSTTSTGSSSTVIQTTMRRMSRHVRERR